MSQDLDPTETQEWLEAFDSICRAQGSERASYILSQLQARATNSGVGLPQSITTPYWNTIPANKEKAPNNLRELSARHLRSLSLGFSGFDFHAQLAGAIDALSVADVQQGYRRMVLDKPRRLWVQTQNIDKPNTDPNINRPIDRHYMYSH